jgi:hypothetical protein
MQIMAHSNLGVPPNLNIPGNIEARAIRQYSTGESKMEIGTSSNSVNTLIYFQHTTNSAGRIGCLNTGANTTKQLEIAAGWPLGSGITPIYVRQYEGNNVWSTVRNELVLLSASGDTIIPNNLTVGGNITSIGLLNSIYPIGSVYTGPNPPNIGTWRIHGFSGGGTRRNIAVSIMSNILNTYNFDMVIICNGSVFCEVSFTIRESTTATDRRQSIELDALGMNFLCDTTYSINVNHTETRDLTNNLVSAWFSRPRDTVPGAGTIVRTFNNIIIDTNPNSTAKLMNYTLTHRCIITNITLLHAFLNNTTTIQTVYQRVS